MSALLRILIVSSLSLSLYSPFLSAEDAAPAVDVAKLKEQIKELSKKQGDLYRQIRSARSKLYQSDVAKELRQKVDEAKKAYNEAGSKDPAVIEAKKASKESGEAVQKLIEEKYNANADVKAIKESQEKNKARLNELRFQLELARFKLTNRYSPVSLKVDQDPEVVELRKASYGGKKTKEERNAAKKAYYEKRKAKVAVLPEGKALLKTVEDSEAEIKKFEGEGKAAYGKLRELRRQAERGEDEQIAAARKKSYDARTAEGNAWNSEKLKAAKSAVTEMEKALNQKVDELAKTDEATSALATKYAEAKKEYDAVRLQLRGSRRKKK